MLYLPPYSPEFNRIEKCSAWLKTRIRKQLHHHWEGVLYLHQLPPRQELDCYIQHYQTVEVNSTYYRGPPNATFAFLAFAPPPRISDDRKSAPQSLRTPSIFTRRSPIASTGRKVRGSACSSTSKTTEREMQFGTLLG